MKGLPIHAVAVNEILSIWFSSPTGDSSDSYVYNITCHNADQARGLASAYKEMINKVVYQVPAETQETIDDLKERLDMYKLAYDSQRLIIQNLQEQLKASEQWFDQTVGIK